MTLRIPLLALAVLSPVAVGAEAEWFTDFEVARKEAAAADKDLLLDFTGSDWCGWCIRLKKEVFDQETFRKEASAKFVLVRVDFPRDVSKLSEKTREQNGALADRYGIQGYPTIVLADPQGRPYAQTGYQEGGAEPYLVHLDELRTIRLRRDQALADAGALEGVDKAKALLNALGNLTDAAVDAFYRDVADQIVAADPTDETGFRDGRDYRRALQAYEGQIEELFGKREFAQALGVADSFLHEHDPCGEDLQHILMAKVMAYAELRQKEEADRVLDAVKAAAPESELGARVDTIRAQIEVFLKEQGVVPKEQEQAE